MSVSDERWHRMMGLMIRAQRTLPDDFWAVGAVQTLAEICCDVEERLTDEEFAVLIGIGAVIIRLGHDETIAGIQAGLWISAAKAGGS